MFRKWDIPADIIFRWAVYGDVVGTLGAILCHMTSMWTHPHTFLRDPHFH